MKKTITRNVNTKASPLVVVDERRREHAAAQDIDRMAFAPNAPKGYGAHTILSAVACTIAAVEVGNPEPGAIAEDALRELAHGAS